MLDDYKDAKMQTWQVTFTLGSHILVFDDPCKGGASLWQSRLQKCLSSSTKEAEYIVDMRVIIDALKLYGLAVGLHVNFNKSKSLPLTPYSWH